MNISKQMPYNISLVQIPNKLLSFQPFGPGILLYLHGVLWPIYDRTFPMEALGAMNDCFDKPIHLGFLITSSNNTYLCRLI